ncbi:GNAT family N-acetyltransferase [Clostridium ihumii]|uniref:GNAT family N-acetyltransferase n=1 Tax=Clostridium ihumii TaxID=1470356 RepID=UPI003D34534F
MEFREFSKEDVIQASKLLANRHKKERVIFPTLKKEFEDSKYTEKILYKLMESSYVKGICAYENNNLLGFLLSNIKTEGMFGRCAFVSYEGLAIADTESSELYRKLYAEIAKIWVKNGALSHFIEVPAGYKEVVDSWLKLSFAFQQVYGITSLSKAEVSISDNLAIRQANKNDSEKLKEISNLIFSYQAGSPTYAAGLPETVEQIREGYGELTEDEDAIVLLAYKDSKLLGFQCANIGEDDSSSMMSPEKSLEISICGTIEESRGTGIGDTLTKLMFNSAIELGFENAIADWRIANLCSSNFWLKQGFQPVAYRMFRTIDERVYWADGIRVL